MRIGDARFHSLHFGAVYASPSEVHGLPVMLYSLISVFIVNKSRKRVVLLTAGTLKATRIAERMADAENIECVIKLAEMCQRIKATKPNRYVLGFHPLDAVSHSTR